jgi:hypothetical protein
VKLYVRMTRAQTFWDYRHFDALEGVPIHHQVLKRFLEGLQDPGWIGISKSVICYLFSGASSNDSEWINTKNRLSSLTQTVGAKTPPEDFDGANWDYLCWTPRCLG